MGGEAEKREKAREERRLREMDELGSEVFNLKLAMQEYEERLAKLYQTEDRSKWRGPATLLADLKAADGEVDRLENTVASLRQQLKVSRKGGGSGSGRSGGSHHDEGENCAPSCGIGDGSGRDEGGVEDDRVLLAENRENEYKMNIAELQAQVTGLEEDNRVLADAAGWELCDTSEGEEEDSLLVQTGPSQRIRVIEALSNRIRELTNLLRSASAKEKDARAAAEDAYARMDDAIARAEELEAAVSHYKRGKASAEGRESALMDKVNEQQREHEALTAAAIAAAAAAAAAEEQKDDGTPGGRVEGTAAAAAVAGAGEEARPVLAEKTATRNAGVNTEEGWASVGAESDRLERLEADVQRWRETCTRTNAQLREERSLGQETTQRLAEKEEAVQQLTARLRQMRTAGATGLANRSSTGFRQRHDRLSFEQSTEEAGRSGGGSNTSNNSINDIDSYGDLHANDDGHTKSSDQEERREDTEGCSSPTAGAGIGASSAAAAAAAAAATTASRNDDHDSNGSDDVDANDDVNAEDDVHDNDDVNATKDVNANDNDESDGNTTGRSKSAASSTDEDAVWKGRARASADTQVNASGGARKYKGMDAAGALHGLSSSSSSSSSSLLCSEEGREGKKGAPADGNPGAVMGGVGAPAPGAAGGGALSSREEAFEEGMREGNGQQQQQQQRRRRRPRWADPQHGAKEESVGEMREKSRAQPKQHLPQQQQQELENSPEKLYQQQLQNSPEKFYRDSPGSMGLSTSKDEAESEVRLGHHSGGLQGDRDGGDVGRDELSTAECSAETTGKTGGGGEAVGVSFDLGSDEEQQEEEEEERAPSADGRRRRQSHHQQGLEQWQQQQQYHQQEGEDERPALGSPSGGTQNLPPVTPADSPELQATAAAAAAAPPLRRHQQWHTRSDSGSSSGRGRAPAAAEILSAGKDDDGDRIAAATRRAENAARRAEASARRAERSAKSARVDRVGAEMAAGEAGSAAVDAKATAAVAVGNAVAPSHGSFGGENTLRPPLPKSLASSSNGRQSSSPTGGLEATARARERSGKTDAERAARLAERASMAARLEALAAATEAERGSATRRSADRGQIRTPWDTATTTVGCTSAAARDRRRRHGDGSHGKGGLMTGDGTMDRREHATAAVPPPASRFSRASNAVAGGRERASSGERDVDYWNRPVVVAAAAVAAAASPRSSSGRSSSSMGAKHGPFVSSEEGKSTRNGLAAGVGRHPRAEEDEPTGRVNFATEPFARIRGGGGGAHDESLLSETSCFGTGLERVAETAAAAASEEASRQQERRRRVLQHVEVGRGGEEHYRDAVKKRVADAASFGSSTGFDADGGGQGRWGLDGDDAIDDHDEEGLYSQLVRTAVGVPPRTGGAREGKVALSRAEGSAALKKKATKKRKNRTTSTAAAAALHSRRVGGHTHGHSGTCARSCASSACPCGQAALAPTTAAKAWRLPRGSFGGRS